LTLRGGKGFSAALAICQPSAKARFFRKGIAMAGGALLNISRDEEQRARLESEYKGAVDFQSKMVQAKRDGLREGLREGVAIGEAAGEKRGVGIGEKKSRTEVLDLIAKGCTLDDIKRELEARGGAGIGPA